MKDTYQTLECVIGEVRGLKGIRKILERMLMYFMGRSRCNEIKIEKNESDLSYVEKSLAERCARLNLRIESLEKNEATAREATESKIKTVYVEYYKRVEERLCELDRSIHNNSVVAERRHNEHVDAIGEYVQREEHYFQEDGTIKRVWCKIQTDSIQEEHANEYKIFDRWVPKEHVYFYNTEIEKAKAKIEKKLEKDNG